MYCLIEVQGFFQHTHVPGLFKYINIGQIRQIHLLHGVCERYCLITFPHDEQHREPGFLSISVLSGRAIMASENVINVAGSILACRSTSILIKPDMGSRFSSANRLGVEASRKARVPCFLINSMLLRRVSFLVSLSANALECNNPSPLIRSGNNSANARLI